MRPAHTANVPAMQTPSSMPSARSSGSAVRTAVVQLGSTHVTLRLARDQPLTAPEVRPPTSERCNT